MNNSLDYTRLWSTSKLLSQSYWRAYETSLPPLRFVLDPRETLSSNDQPPGHLLDHSRAEPLEAAWSADEQCSEGSLVDQDYAEFIKVTRAHQREREQLKAKQLNTQPKELEYYRDISQVDTLIEDNIVEVPKRDHTSVSKQLEQTLIEKYGGTENYQRIRSMEMCLDGIFAQKCAQLKPSFWPVIPLNPKPYYNNTVEI